MARRLSDQQHRRIQARQTQLRQQHAVPIEGAAENARNGLVVAAFGTTLVVEEADGALWNCTLRRAAGRALCGDQVLWQPHGDAQGVVLTVLTRHNQLAHREGTRRKFMAANVDRLIVVLSAQIAFNAANLDRVLVGAALQEIGALIVLNKIDLLSSAQLSDWQTQLAGYRTLGYGVIFTSVKQHIGLDVLVEQLCAHTGVLIGASGVGKSSLVHCLLPDRDIRIGAVSAVSGRGRHTTSAATLYHLAAGGNLIDAPGLSDFGPDTVAPQRIAQAFMEFRPYLGTCKFRDCSHRNEPGCALLDAVQCGAVSAQRLASLHALIAEQSEAK
ncbi:MAG: ribosome small subunit-dependent GTPase A [Gammaproteobacteria bacterium]